MQTPRRPHGPPPRPRRRLNPKFYEHVRHFGTPAYLLAMRAGFRHANAFSMLVCAEEVPDTPTNVGRLLRIADVVGFDRAQLFLDGDR